MNSALEKLSGPGKSLRSEPPDAKEFTGLKRSGHARFADATRTDNLLESRFDLAYNSAIDAGIASQTLPRYFRPFAFFDRL